MTPFRRLLCATDFSEHAGVAARRAATVAATLGAELKLLHVLSEPSLRALRDLFPGSVDAEARLLDDARSLLEAEASRLRESAAGAAVQTVLRRGQPDDEILSASQDAELLVLGAHGQNPLRDMIIGTTAERLLRKAPCPVLVSRAAPEPRYRRVLVPIDFSEHSERAMRAAASIAPGADLTALHVFELPFEGKLWMAGVPDDEVNRFRAQARAQALRRVLDLAAGIGEAGARFRPHVEQGAAARSILELAGQLDADLIVMGRHGKSAAEAFFIGSVTRHVLSDAACDVLVMPA